MDLPIVNIYCLILFYISLCWVFIAACGLSLVVAGEGNLLLCEGFLLGWLPLLQSTDSRASRL